jgi:hypothetical protein
MFKIGLRSVLGAITNACVAKGLKQLNRGHVLYLFGIHLVQNRITYNYAIIWEPKLFHKCYLLIDRIYSRAHEVITVVTNVSSSVHDLPLLSSNH